MTGDIQKMKKVIVTGATGMVGASMIEQMAADRIQVTAIIRPNWFLFNIIF